MQIAEAVPPTGHKALTQAQIDSFWLDGFVGVGKVLSDQQFKLLVAEYDHTFEQARAGKIDFRNLSINITDELEDKNQASQQMLQIMQMCEINLQFRRLAYDDNLLDMIADLIGPNTQLFHDQALYKPAYHGGPVFWHQDNAYWKCTPANLVSAWLTLDDVAEENGAMQFVQARICCTVGHGQAKSTNALLDSGGEVDESQRVVVNLPAGGVCLHHCQTLHYTAPTTTPRQRRAFAIHFMTPGTKSMRTNQYLPVSFGRPMLRTRA